MHPKELTDASLQESIKTEKLLLVDFWAPWCGPCREQGPIIEELAGEGASSAIVKVNIDENPLVAQSLGILSIPTIVLFKDGQVVEMMVGVQSKETLKQKIQQHV